jgi:hypothetical protein
MIAVLEDRTDTALSATAFYRGLRRGCVVDSQLPEVAERFL